MEQDLDLAARIPVAMTRNFAVATAAVGAVATTVEVVGAVETAGTAEAVVRHPGMPVAWHLDVTRFEHSLAAAAVFIH